MLSPHTKRSMWWNAHTQHSRPKYTTQHNTQMYSTDQCHCQIHSHQNKYVDQNTQHNTHMNSHRPMSWWNTLTRALTPKKVYKNETHEVGGHDLVDRALVRDKGVVEHAREADHCEPAVLDLGTLRTSAYGGRGKQGAELRRREGDLECGVGIKMFGWRVRTQNIRACFSVFKDAWAASGGALAQEPPRATRNQPEFRQLSSGNPTFFPTGQLSCGKPTFFFDVFGLNHRWKEKKKKERKKEKRIYGYF